MDIIQKTYTIDAPIGKVWNALVDPHELDAWGAGPSVMEDMEDTEFELWGGEVHGTNLQVVPEELLIQEWYGGKWDSPSHVTIHLTDEGDKTRVEVTQENFPPQEQADLDSGWDEHYFGPLKEYIEGTSDLA